ncbi:MSMEG_0570 family nitrogen starvation response protein [Lichenibacterium minor]|uniref:MSMEG_0570 family nitrogen starvation response protein n=1 Tax=Lichenibacterium minor TaxID=2316528 RepID=A0A4Q2UD93_9HYPH|nr:MSMEG_0570 family nitrogen starvation response protein [Lichenibacterium minor]RYC33261.1 MSMEG_0570 family nitrogen starvation response protein [Lichenibacterium minor]
MPEMRFTVLWPDGSRDSCYSPSLVIKDYLVPGQSYPVDAFVAKAAEALTVASERVKARYGFPCSLALGQLRDIRAAAARQPRAPDAAVLVEAFEE